MIYFINHFDKVGWFPRDSDKISFSRYSSCGQSDPTSAIETLKVQSIFVTKLETSRSHQIRIEIRKVSITANFCNLSLGNVKAISNSLVLSDFANNVR